MRRPITKVVRDIYLNSFSYPLLGTLACIAIFFAVIFKITLKYADHDDVTAPELFVWLASIFSMQGSPKLPKSFVTATVLITALLFSLMSFNVFSASTTSKLSIQIQEIFTPEDLLYDTSFDIGFTPKDEIMLSKSNDTILREVYRRAKRNKLILEPDKAIERCLIYNYAIFGDQRIFRRAIMKLPREDICNVSHSKSSQRA